jgi:hypothetical protein
MNDQEAKIQKELRVIASQKGFRLWRNNVGVAYDNRNVPVRFGLANDSAAMNSSIKSSDLIGIKPIVIQPHHVGSVFGQFVSLECKRFGWEFKGTKRETAQKRWIDLINEFGGYAKFISNVEDL